MTNRDYRVLLADDSIRPDGIEMLRKVASLKRLPMWPPEDDLVDAARDADAILSRSAIISRPVIAASPKLKIVSRHGVGVDYVDVEACTEHGVLVTITGDANSESVSEQALACLLAVARRIALADAEMKAGKWERPHLTGVELYRKVLGIVGLGRIGSRMAKHAKGFDMEVIACDPYIDAERALRFDATLVDLETLLRRSDFVSLHVPLTEETAHMIGQAQLELMKPSAILINTARGPVVDGQALYEALNIGTIAGAGLDVFEEEPLPADHPLRKLDNVVLTPHVAGQSEEAMAGVSIRAAENVLRVLRGETPPIELIVNPEVLATTSRVGRGIACEP
jgi:D-3-phosphoglycerate dehydrogenase